MADLLASDDIYRNPCPRGYRFGRVRARRTHVRAALSRVHGYLRDMVEAIADAKLRRIERELELHGVSCDRPNDRPAALNSLPAERSQGSK
jgi:hypothetical protein